MEVTKDLKESVFQLSKKAGAKLIKAIKKTLYDVENPTINRNTDILAKDNTEPQ